MRWGLGLGVLAILLSAVHAADEEVVWRPYAGYLPDQDWARAAVVLVRDAQTGDPIQGARVLRCPETVYEPESGWAPVWEETFTDEYGLAWIKLDEEDGNYTLDPDTGDWKPTEDGTWTAHWVVDAPGYAPTEEYGQSTQAQIELARGVDIHGRILDALGRPAPGVKVEFKVGCAHAPALRTAFTDTSGRFVLPCIAGDGDICYEGPGVRADYSAPEKFAPTDLGVPTVIADPAAAIVGRIEGPSRAWLAEATVQSRTSSRGPMCRVSPEGRFRLEGAGLREELWLLHPDGPQGVEAKLSPSEYRPGGPIVWYYPEAPEEKEAVEVTVRVHGATPGAWPEELSVFFDRLRDGRRFRVGLDLDGEGPMVGTGTVPPGTYELSAGGSFEAFVAPPTTVDVEADRSATFDVEVTPQPRLEVVGGDALPEDAILYLCLADREELVPDEEEGGFLRVPADARAAVVVRHLDAARSFPVGPVDDGVRRARVVWSPPTVVEVRGYRFEERGGEDEGALPLIDWMEGQPPMHDRPTDGPGGFSFRTYREGRVRLRLRSEVAGHAEVDLVLPTPAGGRVFVDGLAFVPGRPGELRIEGLPDPDEDHPYLEVRASGDLDTLEPDEHGLYRSPLLRDGAFVRVENHTEVLSGPSPYDIVFPTGAILLEVDAEKTCGPPAVYVDGAMWSWQAASASGPWLCPMRGLRAGLHRLIVGAEDHQTMCADVRLGEGEVRRLRLTLPARPEADPPRTPRTESEWWALLDELDDDVPGVHARAREALLAAGDRSLPWLIDRVATDRPGHASHPAYVALLAEMRPELKEILAPSAAGASPPERLAAHMLWQRLSAWRVRSLEGWVELLRTKTSADPMRASAEGLHARLALSSMGAASLPRLLELLGDPEPRVRFWAIRAIVGNVAADDAVLPPLIDRLEDESRDVRRTTRNALLVLAQAGRVTTAPDQGAGPVGDALVGALVEPSDLEDTLVLLRYFPPSPSTDIVGRLTALVNEHPRDHGRVIEVLERLGIPAELALPVLERIVETSDSSRTIDRAEEAIRRLRAR